MATIADLLKHFTVVVNNGSGCIFQTDSDEFTYIFTVKHNLIISAENGTYKKEDVKVSLSYENYIAKIYLPVINVFPHNEKDYAIIQVPKIATEEVYTYNTGSFIRNSLVSISGFPNYMRISKGTKTQYRTLLYATVDNERDNKYERDLILTEDANTQNADAPSNIIGFSGSGIFQEKCNELYLVGIFPKLNDSGATHNKIVGQDLSGFEEIIVQQRLFNIDEIKPKLNVACFLKQSWKYAVMLVVVLCILGASYTYFKGTPDCDPFSGQSDLFILINGSKETDKDSNIKIDKLLGEYLFPFDIINKFMKGNTKNTSTGDLKDLSKECGAHLVVSGTLQECNFEIVDDSISEYFIKQYALLNIYTAKLNSNVEKVSCLLKSYLFEKRDILYVKNNFYASECLATITEKQDTVDQIILQSVALNYERIGEKNAALNTLLKINEGGLNPDSIYKRQERLAEELNRPNDAIIAQTGMIKIAQQKGDKKAEAEILNKRAKNYEKTKEKSKALDDYKKVHKIDSTKYDVKDKIIRLDSEIKINSFSNPAITGPGTLTKAVNQLIDANKFDKANKLLNDNQSMVTNNSTLKNLKTEVDYKLGLIEAKDIPTGVQEKNTRLKTQIRVDKIETSKKILVPAKK
ncbi:MAG: hypothetical protein WAT79_13320 [Saprospiraceae bacterium]